MSIVANLQVFVPAYSITKGAPNSSTLYMVYYIFRQGFQNNRFGYASAVSLIFFAFIAAVTAIDLRHLQELAVLRRRVRRTMRTQNRNEFHPLPPSWR